MATWLLVVLLANLVTLIVLLGYLLSQIDQIVQLMRAARRFQEEVGGLAGEISREAARASERAGRLRSPRMAGRR